MEFKWFSLNPNNFKLHPYVFCKSNGFSNNNNNNDLNGTL